jgi:hypothetical protein
MQEYLADRNFNADFRRFAIEFSDGKKARSSTTRALPFTRKVSSEPGTKKMRPTFGLATMFSIESR